MFRSSSPLRIAGVFLLALLVALTFAYPVHAQQSRADAEATPAADATPDAAPGPRFVIRPVDGMDGDYFTLEAEPGTTNELVVVLANVDDEPLSLRTYANDAVPIVNGGFAIAAEEVPAEGTATWLDYPAETFDFEPSEGVERTFTVRIPSDAAPGQYIAGLALETAEPLEVEGSALFTQIIRKTIAVFIIVPGPEQPAFELVEPAFLTDASIDRFEIPVVNSGNVLVKPAGEVLLRDSDGEIILSAPVAMGSIYAGTTVTLSVPVRTAIPAGDYSLTVELADEATGATASLTDIAITVSSEAEAPAQFTLDGSITPAPDAAAPLYADVSLTVTNTGALVEQAEVMLDVQRDGELVETFVLAPAVALPQGDTTLTQRYIPPAGWESGSWSFVVRLNVIDPSTDSSIQVATLDTIPPVEIEG
jgi:hypothetical protein